MSFCHQCGYALKLDEETSCPSCGIDLKHSNDQNNSNETDYAISSESNENTNFTPYSGTANFDDQLLDYTIIENTIIFDNTGDLSLKVSDLFQRLSHNSNLLYQLMSNNFQHNEDKAQELRDFSNALAKSSQNMLDEVEKIEVECKTRILDIKIGHLQISRQDLELRNLALMGNQFFYLGKYNYAIECYDKILEIDVNDLEVILNKALTMNKLGRYSEAIDWYDKALKTEPKHINALNNKGQVLYKLEEYDEAIECFDKVLQVAPNNVNALNNRGTSLYKLEKYSEAIEHFDKAIKIYPNHVNALCARCVRRSAFSTPRPSARSRSWGPMRAISSTASMSRTSRGLSRAASAIR
jgi:tetratricopeptide (TPR) repeat protein